MAIKIVTANEPIKVQQLKVLVYGQPGLGKTSLAFSAKNPLCLDFDLGMHRSEYRKDGIIISDWNEVVELLKSKNEIKGYNTLIIDTIGRCLDVIGAHLASQNPKLINRNGALTMNGWGELKGVFGNFVKQVQTLGMDIIMLSHDREMTEGDFTKKRPDIQGGSYAEVMKIADLVGYMSMFNGDRTIEFRPTDSSIGKDSARLGLVRVPSLNDKPDFLGEIITKAKNTLSSVSAKHAELSETMLSWKLYFDGRNTAEELNSDIKLLENFDEDSTDRATVRTFLLKRAASLKLEFSKAHNCFVQHAPAPTQTAPPVQTAPKPVITPVSAQQPVATQRPPVTNNARPVPAPGFTI